MTKPTRLKDHLEKLRILNVVSKTASFTKAAANLHMTQAAVSQSIKALEQALEFDLIIRDPRGVRLTERGQILFEFSKRLFLEVEAIEALLEDPSANAVGALRVGTHETLAIHVWPSLLDEFRRQFPRMTISLISGRIDGLVNSLLNYEHHVILTVAPLPRPDIASLVLYEGQIGLYGPAATKKRMSLHEAKHLPILTDISSHLRQGMPLPQLLMQEGFVLNQHHELNSFEAAMRLAILGFGLAMVPDRNVAEAVAAGRLQRIIIDELDHHAFGRYQICASWLRRNEGYKPLQHFLDLLRQRYATDIGLPQE